MTVVDYAIIGLLAVSAVVGVVRGLLREVIALVTWIVALIVAWRYSGLLEPHLGGLLSEPRVRLWTARAILLFAVLFAGAGVGWVAEYLVRLSLFSGMDRFLGFVFGLLRGLVILGVLVMFCQTLRLDGERWWRKSTLIPYGVDMASIVRSLVGEALERKMVQAGETAVLTAGHSAG
jgi:membrane protein required for colicin V production